MNNQVLHSQPIVLQEFEIVGDSQLTQCLRACCYVPFSWIVILFMLFIASSPPPPQPPCTEPELSMYLDSLP